QIAALDADIDVGPPAGHAGTIDRQLLLGTFKDLLGLNLPEQLLPERIEFARIGAKVLVNEGRLRLLGTAGENRDALVVLRLLGQDIPIPAPTETFSIRSVLDRMQARARGVDLETLKRWWRGPGAPGRPASRPASQPDTQPTAKRR
ncbi:MAG: hypothetical protein ACPMAQ_00745, partial [Phycisphaerae bacterium]